ncbi:MAG: shikimate kinase [Ruminococcaceae bacterium]|nr:shikimate kinase [Oscillospiraceae bacterium]
MTSSKPHIILIGMPACGKSTVGVLAAKALGYRFIDSDLVIQETDGRRLHRIIAEEGQAGFLAIEERVNLTLGKPASVPAVIATGGSAVYSEAAMEHFKAVGTVVYLRLSYETVKKRLGNFTHRGVVMPEGYTLRDLYDERCALYEKYADIIVDETQSDRIGDVLNTLCSHFDGEPT